VGLLLILSGLPIGIALMLLTAGIRASACHHDYDLGERSCVSPIILTWTRPELRTIVTREWIKHMAAPVR